MSSNCQKLVDQYLHWLRSKITVKKIDDACVITTPFLDRHNDRMQICVVSHNGCLKLTDDGFVLSDLEASGCPIDTNHRRALLQTILNGFGVREQGGELMVETSIQTFPQKKHSLLQAMMSVNDMFITARRQVSTLFLEDVGNFLEQEEVRFSPNVEFTGKTGFVHKFDYLIPKSPAAPERLIKAINNPTKDSGTTVIFAWTDTRHVRSDNSEFYVFLNDEEKDVSSDILTAFHEYDVKSVVWSDRNQVANALSV